MSAPSHPDGARIASTHSPATSMPGGKGEAKPVESHVAEALHSKKSQIMTQLGSEHGSTFEPVQQRSQVVAGIKYHVKVKTGGDQYIHVGLWRKLDQSYEVTDVKKATADEEL